MVMTIPRYIAINASGEAYLEGSGITIAQLAEFQQRTEGTVETLQHALPYLTTSQIEAGLRYYQAHQKEIEAQRQTQREAIQHFISQQSLGAENWLSQISGALPMEETDEEILTILERIS